MKIKKFIEYITENNTVEPKGYAAQYDNVFFKKELTEFINQYKSLKLVSIDSLNIQEHKISCVVNIIAMPSWDDVIDISNRHGVKNTDVDILKNIISIMFKPRTIINIEKTKSGYYKILITDKINENTEYADKATDISKKFPEMLKLNTHLKYGNFGGLKKPITDKEVLENEELLKKAVIKFDELFKTNYYVKYGVDYSTLLNDPTIKNVYYGDVIKQLIINSFNINIYHNIFKFETNTIEDFIYKFIIYKLVGKDVTTLESSFKKTILSKIPSTVNKKMFLYKFFKNYGNQFNTEVIEEVLGITKKNMYELGGVNIKADKKVQQIFLSTLKKELDKYKDIINTNDILDTVLNKMLNHFNENESELKSVIHERYIIVKLKELLEYLDSIK